MTVRPLDPAVIATDRGADRPTSAEDILDLLDALRPAWHADAACRGRHDLMFPAVGAISDAAYELCARCTVRSECAEAGRTEQYGVWGGVHRDRGSVRHRGRPPLRAAIIDHLARDWHTVAKLARLLPASGAHVSRLVVELRAVGAVDERISHPDWPGNRPTEYRLRRAT